MNGIIHPASHPEGKPAPPTEDDMYLAIVQYLEHVVSLAQPQKILYMAIDGVAPRAKMNQQRSRRFKSAQEREILEREKGKLIEEWQAEGKEIPPASESSFDSNVITPGTPFMDKLAKYLRHFIHQKMATEPEWAKLKIILSDASVPGEGEHKIMEFIRQERAQPGYDANTRHVIHGLDADLIMLALATHEPHFCILREVVEHNPADAENLKKAAEKALQREMELADAEPAAAVADFVPKPFEYMQASVLREYLEVEMKACDYSVAGGFDLERVIDDFVFMCFFVGNDFLPHIPSLGIRDGAIDTLLDLYKKDFARLGGYICNGADVNLERVEILMSGISEVEDRIMERRRRQEDQRNQKKVDIANKEYTLKHIQLIRKCTAREVPVEQAGETAAKRAKGQKTVMMDDTGSFLRLTSETATVENFRIKNRSVGGQRALQPFASSEDARMLHMLDKIREVADGTGAQAQTSVQLKDLDGKMRSYAHSYAEELDLYHKSEGTGDKRYLVIALNDPSLAADDDDDEDEEGILPDDVKEATDAFKTSIRDRVRAANDELVADQVDTVQLGTGGWRERYYSTKFAGADIRHVVSTYVEGLVWVMKYYYQGCQSWNWFFPYHYAPFAKELTDLASIRIEFDIGRPFKPYEQLMAVFPPASSHALPVEYRKLMTDPKSPIADFYPLEFELDLNGHRFAWQAVALLPFIDEKRLLDAISPLEATLTEDEARQNSRGTDVLVMYEEAPGVRELYGKLYPDRVRAVPTAAPGAASAPQPKAADAGSGAAASTVATDAPESWTMNQLVAAQLKAELRGDTESAEKFKKIMDAKRAQTEMKQVEQSALASYPQNTQVLDGKLFGITGFVSPQPTSPALNSDLIPLPFHGEYVNSPHRLRKMTNRSISAKFYVPPSAGHVPRVLPSCTMPDKQLQPGEQPVKQKFTFVMRRGYNPRQVTPATHAALVGSGANVPNAFFRPAPRGGAPSHPGPRPPHQGYAPPFRGGRGRGWESGRGRGRGYGRGRGRGDQGYGYSGRPDRYEDASSAASYQSGYDRGYDQRPHSDYGGSRAGGRPDRYQSQPTGTQAQGYGMNVPMPQGGYRPPYQAQYHQSRHQQQRPYQSSRARSPPPRSQEGGYRPSHFPQ
eukprot:m.236931 g.236931  ORF g.236931 m.236931 type:complete len:1131 (-) comp15267_c1_seq2:4556-7948(-)